MQNSITEKLISMISKTYDRCQQTISPGKEETFLQDQGLELKPQKSLAVRAQC